MKLHYHNILLRGLLAIMAIGITTATGAREIAVKSAKKFDQLVVRNNYAIVMVYQSDREIEKNKTLKRKLDRLESMFKHLSEKYKYEEGGLVFLKVNRVKSDLDMIARDLDVTQVPAFFLFEDGESVKDNGKAVSLIGFITRDNLETFINTHLGQDLEETIEDKEKIRKKRRQEAEAESYYSPYYYPNYYPYGYYPYDYPHGGIGFYFGGGRRFHSGRGRRFHSGRGRRFHGGGGRRFHGVRRGGSRGGFRRGGRSGGMRGVGRRSGGMRSGGMRGGGRGGMRSGGMRGGMRGGRRR